MPCWLDSRAAFYGIPAVDGRGMKVGPDRYGPVFDPTRGERLVDPESVGLVRRYLATRFPDLADGPVIGRHVVGRLKGAGVGEGEERFGLDHARTPQANFRTGSFAIGEGSVEGLS